METIDWTGGAPRSPRFGDIYHSASGALAQAHHVFLGGCDLPAAWRGQATWRILETGFGLGLNFLATWLAWRDDPQRPGRLVFESIEAWPVSPDDIRRAADFDARLSVLAAELATGLAASPHWHDPADRAAVRAADDPGSDRADDSGDPPRHVSLSLDDARVELIVHIGDVTMLVAGAGGAAIRPGGAESVTWVDSVYLDGFSPARNPGIWAEAVLAAIAARTRRGGRLGTWTVAASVRGALEQAGFVLEKRPGLPPKRHCLAGRRQ